MRLDDRRVIVDEHPRLAEEVVGGIARSTIVHSISVSADQRSPSRAQRGRGRVGELLQPAYHERREQLVLGRELAVDARDAGAGLRGDRRHRRVEAVAGEHAPGGVQQPLALGVAVERGPLTLGRRQTAQGSLTGMLIPLE